MLDAIALVFPSANRTLYQHIGSLRQRSAIIRKPREADDPVPVGAAFPLAISVLPAFFLREREGGDESAVWRIVRLGIVACEADDGELIHCVHAKVSLLPPVVPGATEKRAAALLSERKCIVEGPVPPPS